MPAAGRANLARKGGVDPAMFQKESGKTRKKLDRGASLLRGPLICWLLTSLLRGILLLPRQRSSCGACCPAVSGEFPRRARQPSCW